MQLLHSLFDRLRLSPFLPKKPWQVVLFAGTGLFVAGVLFVATVALILTPTLPSLEDLSGQLMGDGKKGIKNVSWSPPKRA